jgi:DNA-binding NarL/FixJ family response regulator
VSAVTIVLADDHPVVRQGLRALLDGEPGLQVVGEAAEGLQVTPLVERLRPDVLVLDVLMPGLSGLEVARQVRQRCPATRVLILSMHANLVYVAEAFRNGATGYVVKDAGAASLLAAVRAVAAGRRYLSPPLSQPDVQAYADRARTGTRDPYDTLTPREREVLHLAAEGHTNPEIAGRLGISPRTAETHRANIMRKLRLQSQTDLVRYAVQRGIVRVDAGPGSPPGR